MNCFINLHWTHWLTKGTLDDMTHTSHHLADAAPRVARLVGTARDELRERRAVRAAARDLARDLGTYTTPREIEDLLATLERSEEPAAEAMRSLLTANLHAYHVKSRPLAC